MTEAERRGEEWDEVCEAHDISAADHRNYVTANHPMLPGIPRPDDADFAHRDFGCTCICARYTRDEYIALGK